jgi:hypothetical protein
VHRSISVVLTSEKAYIIYLNDDEGGVAVHLNCIGLIYPHNHLPGSPEGSLLVLIFFRIGGSVSIFFFLFITKP